MELLVTICEFLEFQGFATAEATIGKTIKKFQNF
jgi:hypothetical protein